MFKTQLFIFLIASSVTLSVFANNNSLQCNAANETRELPQVIAYGSDHGSSPADNLCFVANSRFTPYKDGWVVPFTCLGGADLSTQIWYVRNGKSQLLQESKEGRLLSKVYSDGHQLAWTEFDELGTKKLHVAKMNETENAIQSNEYSMPSDWKWTYLNSLAFLENGKIWFAMTKHGEGAESVSGEGYWQEGVFFRSSFAGRSYFFTAESSQQMIVQKTRSGNPGDTADEQPDQIEVRLAPHFEKQVVFSDRDGDPQSNVIAIWNSGAIQRDRWAFFATAIKNEKRVPALILGKGLNAEVKTLETFFKSVDAFNPAILQDGRVAIRATSTDGVYGLWLFDGNSVKLIATKGDKVVNERGSFMMTEKPFNTSPASSGNDIVIGVTLADPATGEVLEQDVVRWEISK